MWDGIIVCMNSKQCKCGKCKCDLNTAHEAGREILRVHDFLSRLDDSVHGVSQICAITPLPDLESVYQTLVLNETIRSFVAHETQVMSFASQLTPSTCNCSSNSGFRPSGNFQNTAMHPANRDPSRKYSVCVCMGHETSPCFKVVRFSEWYGASGHGRGTSVRGRGMTPRENSTQTIGDNPATLPSLGNLIKHDR